MASLSAQRAFSLSQASKTARPPSSIALRPQRRGCARGTRPAAVRAAPEHPPAPEKSSDRPHERPHADSHLVSIDTTDTVEATDEAKSPISGLNAKVLASLGVVAGVALLAGGSVVLKEPLRAFIEFFVTAVDDWGPLGYVAFIGAYACLEVLAVPALPLTMTAGAIFGIPAGTACVSCGATIAATVAFLLARYVARDRVVKYASSNPTFARIDRAIGAEGFKVVALLRLSPLLPLAASNYLYGLTSVSLTEYVLGSWVGMLPGTAVIVATGTYGKQLLLDGGGGVDGFAWWQVAGGVGFTALAIAYIGRLATKALADAEASEEAEAEAAKQHPQNPK